MTTTEPDIEPEPDIDIVLKGLDRLAETARKASVASTTLAEKLRFQKIVKTYELARHEVRKTYFDAEDAEKLAPLVSRCECGALRCEHQ